MSLLYHHSYFIPISFYISVIILSPISNKVLFTHIFTTYKLTLKNLSCNTQKLPFTCVLYKKCSETFNKPQPNEAEYI